MLSQAPPNAYQPHTKLVVGSHNVSIIKYISQGGFAHVYTCTIDPPFRGNTTACLKRVAVPSKLQLNLLRQEVDAMKRLKGNKYIVSYIDSHASRMDINQVPNGGGANHQQQQYEVFLLMEYCSRNGLIDFMNTRLSHKLQEQEILNIMRDVTAGVAMCHNLQPPLLHRDIKIENVLIDQDGTFKLCDFGSAVNFQPAPKTPQETILLKNDIMQYTTPQYRAPEMLELSRGFPIDDKLDIWALGCLLYKLCYYITPFELPNHQSLADMEKAILTADHSLIFPHDQPGLIFLPRLKNIVKCCLREDPRRRPSAIQLLGEVCAMLHEPIPDVIPSTVKQRHKSISPQQQHPPSLQNIVTPVSSIASNNTVLTPSSLQNSEISFHQRSAKTDPFISIDKSKFLQPNSSISANSNSGNNGAAATTTTTTTTSTSISRPMSTYFTRKSSNNQGGLDSYHRYSHSSSSLKEYVQMKVDESSNEVVSSYRKSEDNGTLDFLRSKQDSQNTGGSFKMNFLRKISTGGIGTNGTGGSISSTTSNLQGNHYKRSSISSIKQLLTGGSSRKVSQNDDVGYELFESAAEIEKRPSIRKRMAMLVNSSSSNASLGPKTASGYGKYTESNTKRKTNEYDDIDAINNPITPYISSSSNEEEKLKVPKPRSKSPHISGSLKPKPKPPMMPSSLNKTKIPKTAPHTPNATHQLPKPTYKLVSKASPYSNVSPSYKASAQQTLLPPIPKKPPPKPKKPVFLKSDMGQRKLSNSSDVSLPDIDDLEKDFSKRFPSRVL